MDYDGNKPAIPTVPGPRRTTENRPPAGPATPTPPSGPGRAIPPQPGPNTRNS